MYGDSKDTVCEDPEMELLGGDEASLASPTNPLRELNGTTYYPLYALSVSGRKSGNRDSALVTCQTDRPLYLTRDRTNIVFFQDTLLVLMVAMAGFLAYVVYKGRKRKTGIISGGGEEVETISFDELRDSMSEILDISPKEIDELRDQLVDQHGNVPPHKVLWLRDRYAKRYNAIMQETEDT